jgi:uncharacterized Rossmann fold enzyme
MLNVCCVALNLDTYLDGRARDAVEILYSMVRRNLAAGLRGRFTVFTDNPAAFDGMAGVQTKLLPSGLIGWWNKLALFADDAFPKGERVLYFDLDTVITGPLDDIAAYRGEFAILRDVYRPKGYQSSVMAWEAGNFTTRFWDTWDACGRREVEGGDQAWIEERLAWIMREPDIFQKLFPGQFRSYKIDCTEFVPKGTRVVFFHGLPRPHQAGGWVTDVWKITDHTLFFSMNVKEEQVRQNIRHALSKPRWIEMRDGTQFPALIVGGGPSLEGDLWRIRGWQLSGGVVFATNNTVQYLQEQGIRADAHVMHDARPQNAEFVPTANIPCYYASQCHPDVLDAAGDRLICWHPHSETCLDEIGENATGPTMLAGGSTVGLNALALAYVLGHRQMLLFGFDSSYEEGEHHAYSQALNDGELILEVKAHGETFRCAPWMIQQCEQFLGLVNQLTALGCEITVYGRGLIPTVAAHLQPVATGADLRAKSVLGWLQGTPNPVGAEIGVFAGELSRRLLQRPDLKLYLVDSWGTTHSDGYRASNDFHANLTLAEQERFYRITHQMVYFAGPRAKILRQDSREAAKAIPDGSLDFVFIDADHSYEGCRADIEAWRPKIKKGGFISGHDYENPDFPAWGVKQAVLEFFGTPELGEHYTWKVTL